jgi:hypothetical protein
MASVLAEMTEAEISDIPANNEYVAPLADITG